jgi:hypothetical protein
MEMSSMSMKVKFLVLLSLVILSLLPQVSSAQQSPFIHVCIIPVVPQPSEPYLLTFRDTSLFGLVIPHEAEIIVFTDAASVSAALHNIAIDTQTGNYRPTQLLTMANTTAQTADSRCSPRFSETLTDKLTSTTPFPVSRDRALLVQLNNADRLQSPEFLGAFGIIFNTGENFSRSFQLIQLSQQDPAIQMRLPFVQQNTTFTVVANKGFGMNQSFLDADTVFHPEYSAASRDFLKQQVTITAGLNLFEILQSASIRIYPHSGMYATYLGGYIRLGVAPNKALREPAFSPGIFVKALEGTEAAFYRVENGIDKLGTLKAGTTAEVVRIEDNGRLIVRNPTDGGEVVIESWLVEVAE